MAHVLDNSEKAVQRAQKQWSKTFLAIPEYHTIFTARLNGVPASNDMVAEIDYDTPTGTLSNVLPDMTLYVSSIGFGKYDLGMCRIRKNPISGTFYIGENSDIVWVDQAYLTVVDDYSLWQKSLRLVAGEPFMDWDVEYSDQHEDFDPVPCMGTHRVAKLTGATVDVILGPASDTSAWVIGSTIASRLWLIVGASLDDNTAVNPVGTFSAAGTYLAYCTFTAANGKSFKGVRYIIIYDDDNPLLRNFAVNNGRGSFDGGYSFDATLFSGFDVSVLRKRSLVILCTEDFAENTPITLPGQIEGAENILCVGRIADIDNSRTSEFGEVSFNVQSDEFWMRKIRDFPTGLELQTTSTGAWIEMPSLNVNRAMWHFLHWRSTATRVMDIQHTNDGRLSSRFNIARENLWERLVQIMQPTIFASPHVDNFGRLFAFIEPQMIPEGSRSWPVVMELLDADIEDNISWVRRDVPQLSMLFFSGIAVDGSGGAKSFFSMSPGHSYAHFGEEESQDNYLVSDQTNSNELCGLYYGWKNNPIDNLELNFSHSLRALGLFPRQFFYYNLSAANDPRGIGFAGNLIPRDISFSVNPDTGFISISATMEPESFPGPAIDGDVPTMETVDFSTDNFDFDPILPLDFAEILPPDLENPNQPKKVIIGTSKGVLYTENFDAAPADVEWFYMNDGIPQADYETIQNILVTPGGSIYVHCDNGSGSIYRATVLGGTFSLLAMGSSMPSNNGFIVAMAKNPNQNEQVAFASGVSGAFHFYLTDGTDIIDAASGITYRQEYGQSIVYAGNRWYHFGSVIGVFQTPFVVIFDEAGSSLGGISINSAVGQDAAARWCAAIGTGELVLEWDASASNGAYNVLTGYPFVLTTPLVSGGFPKFYGNQGIAPSPSGVVMMGTTGGLFTPYKTTDSGGSWASMAGTIPVGSDVWENCRDDRRWIFGGGSTIRLTMDAGLTYIDKMGNLLYIAALADISQIRFIE